MSAVIRRVADELDPIDPDASDASDDEPRYRPPASPDEDRPVWLAVKVATAMVLAQWLATSAGFEQPTWSVLTAALLATSPPLSSAGAAGRKVLATFVGIALGAAGAYASQALASYIYVHVVIIGLVAGSLGTRSPDYLHAAVVGTVVTFLGASGSDPVAEVVFRTACMILIGCAVGPVAVHVVERIRRALWRRGSGNRPESRSGNRSRNRPGAQA